MDFGLELESRKRYQVVHIRGRFCGSTVPQVRKAIETSRARGYKHLAFELGETTFVDSAALGFLAGLCKDLRAEKGNVHLTGIGPQITGPFRTSKLLSIIPTYTSLAEIDRVLASSVDEEEAGTYYVITVHGNFDVNQIAAVRGAVEKAMAAEHTKVVFDLSDTTMLTSSGIGLMVNVHNRLKTKDGNAVIVGAHGLVRESLETTKVLTIVPNHDTVDDAERSADL